MSEAASLTTTILALGTIFALVAAIVLFVLIVSKKGTVLLNAIRPHALLIAFALALGASILTLIYSEVWGIAPCGWCWFQRICMYPIALLLAVALVVKDSGIWKYVVALCIPGGLIALYQHALQVGVVGALPCPATPGVADCAQRIIFEYGFVTFPLMAFAGFALIAALMLLLRRTP